MAFVHESLSSSAVLRPWVIVEGPDERQLFVGGFPRELRQAVADKRVFWLKASREEALPELVQMLLDSSLCEGVLLRGFERFKSEHKARAWMRRWQLGAEKTRTHLLWVHEKACEILGVNLRVEWTSPQHWNVRRGDGLLETTPFKTLRALRTKTNSSTTRRSHADRETTRTA
ncbi:MAG: hypothetical protein ABIR96_07535 [Bdellovibrionota bacterium]